MAHHKSAKKRIRQTKARSLRNKIATSRARTVIKKMRAAIETKNKDEALKLLPQAQSELRRLAKTGALDLNNASRKTSRLAKQVATL